MASMATADQPQEVQAQTHEGGFEAPERLFETWECVETLPYDCVLPMEQRRRHGGVSTCPNHSSARRILSNVIQEYRYTPLDLLDVEEREKELFKIALADVDPKVTLPQILIQTGQHEWKAQTCCWTQTRAYLGVEGLMRGPDCWEFDVNEEEWSEIIEDLITHEAVRKIDPGTSFGTDIAYLRMEYDDLSMFVDDQSFFQAGQLWESKFEECLSDLLQELSGSLPSFSLYSGRTRRSTTSPQTRCVVVGSCPLGDHDDNHCHDLSGEVEAIELQHSIAYWQSFEAARSFDPDDDFEFCPLPDEQTWIGASSSS